MITVHHLNNSRSQRVLWFLEELDIPYTITFYERDATTNLAPPELKGVHPLGKSPVVTDGANVVAESGAILDYLAERYGGGRFHPAPGTADALRHTHFMHFAEGSAMTPLLLRLYVGRLGAAGEPLWPRITSEIKNHLDYLEGEVGDRPFLVGDDLTCADCQVSFVLEAAQAGGSLEDYPRLRAYLSGLQARPAYRRGLEKGGPYAFGPQD
ncbi:MAG: glutathione S-transferase family protein [Alphaproteobacteria bacterium]